MTKKNYCIHSLYRTNNLPDNYSDVGQEDGWQLEVYLRGLGLMIKNGYQSVIDVGCGSAYKLMTYFDNYQTIGIDTAPTCDWLRNKYPQKKWLVSDFKKGEEFAADLVICSDVIEHVPDPDQLLAFINRISFRHLILSTPCREVMYPKWHKLCYIGPPSNKSHIREWSYNEFREYVSGTFKVLEHQVTNIPQGTQMILCTKR